MDWPVIHSSRVGTFAAATSTLTGQSMSEAQSCQAIRSNTVSVTLPSACRYCARREPRAAALRKGLTATAGVFWEDASRLARALNSPPSVNDDDPDLALASGYRRRHLTAEAVQHHIGHGIPEPQLAYVQMLEKA